MRIKDEVLADRRNRVNPSPDERPGMHIATVTYAHRPGFYLKAHRCLHGRCIIRMSARGLGRLIGLLLTRGASTSRAQREPESAASPSLSLPFPSTSCPDVEFQLPRSIVYVYTQLHSRIRVSAALLADPASELQFLHPQNRGYTLHPFWPRSVLITTHASDSIGLL